MVKQRKLNTPEKRARVGERIKVAATQAGISLKDLAEQASVSPSAIYQYVRGITAVPLSLLDRIAIVTRVHPDFFDPDQDARQTLAMPLDAPSHDISAQPGSPELGATARIEAEYRQVRSTAEALRSAREDRGPYVSALQRMFALSTALESRGQSAAILAQIGHEQLEAGDPAAAEASLREARELAGDAQPEVWGRATLDIARCLAERGERADALRHLKAIRAQDADPVSWRALLLIGENCLRSGDTAGALQQFESAARVVLELDSLLEARDGRAALALALAQVAVSAGDFRSARALSEHAAHRAETDRDATVYLRAMTELSCCEEALGDLGGALLSLQRITVLTAFRPDAGRHQANALARLSRVQIILGLRDAARENARSAERVAHQTGAARDASAAGLAMARMRLSAGDYREALEFAGEALVQARHYGSASDEALAHLLRAEAHLCEYAAKRDPAESSPDSALRRALDEAQAALAAAGKASDLAVRLESQCCVAEVNAALGRTIEAENAATTVVAAIDAGPASLRAVIETETDRLCDLMSPLIDLRALFRARARLDMPMIEWRVHTLLGQLAATRGDIRSAFSAYRRGAELLWTILSRLTPSQAAGYQLNCPKLSILLSELHNSAAAVAATADVQPLLDRLLLSTELLGATAVVASDSPAARVTT